MISKFGIFIRDIRRRENDSLRSMAKKLDISATFLSAMEVGRKQIPLDYIDKITILYDLTTEENEILEDAIKITNEKVLIELDKMNEAQKELSLIFSRKIKNADSQLIEKLRKVLDDKN